MWMKSLIFTNMHEFSNLRLFLEIGNFSLQTKVTEERL